MSEIFPAIGIADWWISRGRFGVELYSESGTLLAV
jgi:hypothetical protein